MNTDLYLGKTADVNKIEAKDFDGFVKVGETVAPTIPAQLHHFPLEEKVLGRYFLIHKRDSDPLIICEVNIA